MPTILVTVRAVTQNSLHPLSASSIIACRFLEFMLQGKITDADAPTIHLDATPSGHQCPHLYHPPNFTWNAVSVANLPVYPGLGQAPNNAGLHTWWISFYYKVNPVKTWGGYGDGGAVSSVGAHLDCRCLCLHFLLLLHKTQKIFHDDVQQ